MNEIALSNDLNVITAEIKTWKSFAGMSVWEIGKRIKHVKENDLTHGNYINWLNEIGIDRSEAYRYIRIAEDLPNDDTWQHLSSRAMYLITTLPPEQKQEQIQRVNDGHQPTVKEIENLKRENRLKDEQLKQKDELIENMADSMHDFELHAKELADENEQLKNRKPEVIEKEVIPEDYEDLKRTTDYLTKRNEHLEKEHQDLLNQRKEVNEKSQKYDELTNAIQQSQGELNRVQQQIADYDGLHKVLKEGNALLAKLSVLVYSDLSDAVANDTLVKNELDILLSRFLKLNEDITKKITNNMIIEGEIIND